VVEAVLLIYPTFEGLLLVLGAVLPALAGAHKGQDFIEALLGLGMLFGLVVGWLLLGTYVFRGRDAARRMHRPWWISASAVAATCLIAFVLRLAYGDGWWETMGLGIFFLPTYVHLTADVWLRTV
jgi:hypothetical protein